jgi:hypothetical protein
MQKPQIVAHFLVPADQHAPEAIHPTMRALDVSTTILLF